MTGSHLNEFIVVSMRTVSVFCENVTYAISVPRFTSDKSRGSMLLPLSFFSSRHFVPRSESGGKKQRSTLFKIMAIRNDQSHSIVNECIYLVRK